MTVLNPPRRLVLVRSFAWVVMLAALLVAVPSTHAQTTTIIDTFGPGNSFTGAGTVSGTSTIVNAVRITIPVGTNLSIVSVDMALGVSGSVSTAQIGIFNDSGGLPVGMPIVFATVPGPLFSAPSFQSTPFTTSPTLTGGQSYWVAPIITGSGNILWSSGLAGATSAAFYNGTSWSAQSTPNPLAIRVLATSATVACCNARGTGGCILLGSADCAAVGGVNTTGAATCAAALCTINVNGACCLGSACAVSTSLGCTLGAGGRFLGPASSCTPAPGGPNPCCPADFNNSGALSAQDIFDYLNAWFAGCP